MSNTLHPTHSLAFLRQAGALGVGPPRLALSLPTEPTRFPGDASLTQLRAAALPPPGEERAPPPGTLETYLRALPAETAADVVFQWAPDALTTSVLLERTVALGNLATLRTRAARDLREPKARCEAFRVAAGLWEAVAAQHEALGPADAWAPVREGTAPTCPPVADRAYAEHQAAVCMALARLARYAQCVAAPPIDDWAVSLPVAMAAARAWVHAPKRDSGTAPETAVLSAVFASATYAHHTAALLASGEPGRLGQAVYLLEKAVNTCADLLARVEKKERSTADALVHHKRRLEARAGRRTTRHPVRDSVVADAERGIYDEWDVCADALRQLYDAVKRDYEALSTENRDVVQDPLVPPTLKLPAPLCDARFHAEPQPCDVGLLVPDRAAPVPAPASSPGPRPASSTEAALAQLPADVRAYVRELEQTVSALQDRAPALVATTAREEAAPFYRALGVPAPAWVVQAARQ